MGANSGAERRHRSYDVQGKRGDRPRQPGSRLVDCSLALESSGPLLLFAYFIRTTSPSCFLRGTSWLWRIRKGNPSSRRQLTRGEGRKGAPPCATYSPAGVPPGPFPGCAIARVANPVANARERLEPRRLCVKRYLAVLRCGRGRQQPGTGQDRTDLGVTARPQVSQCRRRACRMFSRSFSVFYKQKLH